jgi:hypothetical protein
MLTRRTQSRRVLKAVTASALVILLVFASGQTAFSADSSKKTKRPRFTVSVSGSATRSAPADLDRGLPINAHLRFHEGNQGTLENASDPCFGPTVPTYEVADFRSIFAPPPPTTKPGVSTIGPKLIRKEKLVKISCDGKLLRAFWKCVPTDGLPACPVPRPFDPLGMAINLMIRKVVTFEPPDPDFYPKPSNVAPLVGVGFFYGVMQDQFDRIQNKYLTVCDLEECATVLLRATPEEVHFDAANGLGMKTTCDYAGPGVDNKSDAQEAEDFCRVDYKRAGKYRTTMKLLYSIRASVINATSQQVVNLTPSAPFFGTTTTTTEIIVRQRQPVVIG